MESWRFKLRSLQTALPLSLPVLSSCLHLEWQTTCPCPCSLHIPATTFPVADLADLPITPLILSASVPSPTPDINSAMRCTIPNYLPFALPMESPSSGSSQYFGILLRNEHGGPLHSSPSVTAVASFTSDLLRPPCILALSFRPSSCRMEAPVWILLPSFYRPLIHCLHNLGHLFFPSQFHCHSQHV